MIALQCPKCGGRLDFEPATVAQSLKSKTDHAGVVLYQVEQSASRVQCHHCGTHFLPDTMLPVFPSDLAVDSHPPVALIEQTGGVRIEVGGDISGNINVIKGDMTIQPDRPALPLNKVVWWMVRILAGLTLVSFILIFFVQSPLVITVLVASALGLLVFWYLSRALKILHG